MQTASLTVFWEDKLLALLVLGSIALDTIETERGTAVECLGGSASHAALAASYFVKPILVGVVGDDFAEEHHRFLGERIDTDELAVLTGKTFRWHGFHSLTTGETVTKATHLNTYEQFKPTLSERTAACSHVLLGNIDPELQLHVLGQLKSPKMVACDTMSLWIDIAKEKVVDVMGRVDLFLINEQESYELTGEATVTAAGEAMLAMGASRAIIKCGSRPARLFGDGVRREIPTVPGVDVTDPTGAGDNFAGALLGYMAKHDADVSDTERLTEAMKHGSAIASYAIETFGTEAHKYLTLDQIAERLEIISRAG